MLQDFHNRVKTNRNLHKLVDNKPKIMVLLPKTDENLQTE